MLLIAREYFNELDEVIRVADYDLHHVDNTIAVKQGSPISHVTCLL